MPPGGTVPAPGPPPVFSVSPSRALSKGTPESLGSSTVLLEQPTRTPAHTAARATERSNCRMRLLRQSRGVVTETIVAAAHLQQDAEVDRQRRGRGHRDRHRITVLDGA